MDDPAYREGDRLRKAVVDLEGMRTLGMVPLLKGERLVGASWVHRREVRPFSDAQIALLRTFADQAVIAIENVRLFREREAKTASLTEALDRQTATSDILRVISTSPTDLQPSRRRRIPWVTGAKGRSRRGYPRGWKQSSRSYPV